MWHHKNKYHDNIIKNDQKMTTNDVVNDHLMTTDDHFINNKIDIEETKLTENTICMYCNKKLSAYTHLRRHIKKCKKKEDIEKENEELKQMTENQEKEMNEMRKSLDELKKLMLDMMNKKCKMHPKTFQKMVNSHNSNNSNNTNNTINMTINNNIQYVELGDEELHKVFTEKEKMKILCGLDSPMNKIIRHAHLNNNYPQFQNIIITNAKGNQAYTYNKELKKFVLNDKVELLEDLITYRFDDLVEFYKECKDKLDPDKRRSLEKLFLLKNDDEYYTTKSKEFNVIIYNECNKDNIKYKQDDILLENPE